MKVSLALLTITLLIASYNAATFNLDVTAGLSCISPTGCTLGSSIFGSGSAAPGSSDTVVLNAGIFAAVNPSARVLVNVASSTTLGAVQLIGASSQLVVQAGATLTTTGNVTLGASSQLIVSGSATITGVIAVANGASSQTIVSISGSVMANGGINMAGSNTQLTVSGSASAFAYLTIGATSVLQGSISWSTNAAITIQSGLTTLYTSSTGTATTFTTAANTSVNSQLAVLTSTTANTYGTFSTSGTFYLGSNAGASATVNASITTTASGILSGAGTIYGSVSITTGSQISLGNSPGTAYVTGNYNQDSGSTFNLDVAGTNNYDKLIVTGTASINGYLKVIQYNGYVPGQTEKYDFITAGNGVSGTFNSPILSSPITAFYKYSASYSSNNAYVTYNNKASAAVVSVAVLAIACVMSLF